MILWPAGMALVAVWLVFRDPAVDHRMVVAGAVVPDAVDAPFGGARVLHTVVAAAVVLVVVMLATRGHRHARRRWIFLPIGILLHLAFDGMWTETHTFWWPAFGWSLGAPLPALDHGLGVLVAEEVAGAVALGWFWRRFRLGDRAVRTTFWRTGRLPRGLVG